MQSKRALKVARRIDAEKWEASIAYVKAMDALSCAIRDRELLDPETVRLHAIARAALKRFKRAQAR